MRPVPIRFQHARAGSEALIHAVRAAVEADPRTTVLSIDGVGAYDHISRASMFTALRDLASLASLLPFSMLFYGQASRYSFYDGEGRRHEVLQAEGGEQGDPLMPGLYALGQHAALREIAARLSPGDKLYAFLDDVYSTTKPERALDALRASQHCLAHHANVQVHLGKTRAWADPANPSWVGSWALPAERQGQVRRKHDELLQRLPEPQHLQTAWLLLLYCAAPRCQYLLRTLPPAATGGLRRHMMGRCSRASRHGRGQLPLRMGGMGLASAVAHRQAAYWASWADTVGALQAHHPDELEDMMRHLLGGKRQV